MSFYRSYRNKRVVRSRFESVEEQRRLWQEMTADALEQVQEYGVTVYYPDKQPFIDKVQPMHARYEGTPVGDLMQRIKEVE